MSGQASGQQPRTVTDAASGVAGEAGRTIEKSAAQGMTQVSETLRQVAEAARQASQNLQTQQPQIGRFMSTGADKLDEAASYVSEHEPRELIDEAQTMARRQPAVVIAGGLIAGLVLGRVLRTAGSSATDNQGSGRDWYSRGYNGSTGSVGTSGVSSGYGTGYGASYDREPQGVMDRSAYGSVSTTESMTNGGSMSDPAEV